MGGRSPFAFLGAYLCRCLNGCTYSWDCVDSFVMSSYHSVSLKAICQSVGSQWILCTKINSSLYALEVQHSHILSYPGYPESPFPAKLIILYPIGISRALIGGKLLPIPCCKVILPYFLHFFFAKLRRCHHLEYSSQVITTSVQRSSAQGLLTPMGNMLGCTWCYEYPSSNGGWYSK